MKTICFGGTEYTCPFADVMPPLTAEERAELKADIEQNGIAYPVIVTDTNELIDGLNRLEIAVELGLSTVPLKVLDGLSPERKRAMAEDLNTHRRHLSREQKHDLIARRLKAEPNRSNNAIATELQVSDKTVGSVRANLEACSEIPNTDKRVDTSGRKQPATKPPRPKAPVKPHKQPAPTPDPNVECSGSQEVQPEHAPTIRKHQTEAEDDEVKRQSQPVLPFLEAEDCSGNEEMQQAQPSTEQEAQPELEPEAGDEPPMGVMHAEEAIHCLSRIYKVDELRVRGIRNILEWIQVNHRDVPMPEHTTAEQGIATVQPTMAVARVMRSLDQHKVYDAIASAESGTSTLKRLLKARSKKWYMNDLELAIRYLHDAIKILRGDPLK
jgi:ParB-like chromosome segregation protein Spo0J